MIDIIDYGIGNLRSIEKAFEHVGAPIVRSDRFEDIRAAEKLVLPGVGAFGACAGELRRRGLEAPIKEAVAAGKPLLGVCIGMQMLFEESEELGIHQGLGLLPGRVVRFATAPVSVAVPGEPAQGATPGSEGDGAPAALKVPHMGWNTLYAEKTDHPLLQGISEGSFFYFVHSYHVVASREEDVLATTTYGYEFASIVARGSVFGVQFHPEKSHRNGLRILENFAKL